MHKKNIKSNLLKNIFINIQTYVRDMRTFHIKQQERESAETGRYYICNSVDSLTKVL